MRTKKSLLNLATGLMGQMLALLASLMLRVVMSRCMETAYLGLSGLFTNILSMLSLVELGVGPAITFSLYKPLAERDTEKTKSLMRLYQKAYRSIGCAVLLLGFLFTPVYPHLIKDAAGVSQLNIIYWLYVLNTGISYFYSYKGSLIIADQNQYIKNIGHYIAYVLMHAMQAIILITTRNYIIFLICQVLFTAAENIVLSHVADRMYPFLKEREIKPLLKADTEPIVRNIRAMLCHNIGNMVVNSTDNILVSRFLGLTVSGIYSNYAMILLAVRNILARAFDAVLASVGNLNAEGEKGKIRTVFDRLFFLAFWLFGLCAICLMCLMQPFIRWVFGEAFLLDNLTLMMLVLSFYVTGMRSVLYVMRAAAGLYHRDWAKPIAEAIVNLVASIWLMQRFGIAGVFMGTIVSAALVGTWVEAYIVCKDVLEVKLRSYFVQYGQYALIAAATAFLVYGLVNRMPDGGFVWLALKGIVTVATVNSIYAAVYLKSEEFVYFRRLASGILKAGKR